MPRDDFAVRELAAQAAAGLTRRLRPIDGPQDTWVNVDGKRALLLCSNNYLGLANHPALIEASQRAAAEYGVGAGASRLISGSMRLHHDLEARLAQLKSCERALLFTSGYQANIGAITALVGRGDAVFSDELNHASLIDGCRLSRAAVHVYPHADMEALADQLAAVRGRRKLIVTDSIFSMDGDTAPLRQICDLADEYDAMVLVDEAHATGCVGPHGAGVLAAEGLQDRVTVQMGTLGKALGTFGAFVAARRSIIELMVNKARSFIFTTALPPPVIAATHAALDVLQADDQRQQRLADNAAWLAAELRRRRLPVGSPACHIMPIHVGGAPRTMQLSEALLDSGVFVQGIRPPTVPDGTARLRVTLMATHTEADLQFAAETLRRIFGAGQAVSEDLP